MLIPISWGSTNFQRVFRSFLAAEIQAIAGGQDVQDFCPLVRQEITAGRVDLGDSVSEIHTVPGGIRMRL